MGLEQDVRGSGYDYEPTGLGFDGEPIAHSPAKAPMLTNLVAGAQTVPEPPPGACGGWATVVQAGDVSLANVTETNPTDPHGAQPVGPNFWYWGGDLTPLPVPPTKLRASPAGAMSGADLAQLLWFYLSATGGVGGAKLNAPANGRPVETTYVKYGNLVYRFSFRRQPSLPGDAFVYPAVDVCTLNSGAVLTLPSATTPAAASSSSTPWIIAGIVGAVVIGGGIWYATR